MTYRIYSDSGYERTASRKRDAERLARRRSLRDACAVYVMGRRTGYWSKHVAGVRKVIDKGRS